MADKCPNCGETLITRTIQKKLGLGSIDFPVAQICQKCNWSKDLTGAGDIVVKPPSQEDMEKSEKKPEVVRPAQQKPKYAPEKKVQDKTRPSASGSAQKVPDTNKIITILLALIVIAGIVWAFLPKGTEQPIGLKPDQSSVSTPKIIATAATTATAISGITPTGNTIKVRINGNKFINPNQKNLPIKPGDGVIWVNDDIYSLTLVSKEGLFEEKLLGNGKQTPEILFKNTGVYNFDIKVKDVIKFNGTVIVEP